MTQQLLQIRKYVCIFSWLSAVMVLLTLINHCSVLNTPKSSWSLSWTVLTNFLWQLVTMSTFRDSWSRWAFSVTVGQDEHFPWQLVNMSTFRDSWSRWALSVTLVQDEHFPWQLVINGHDEHFPWQLVKMSLLDSATNTNNTNTTYENILCLFMQTNVLSAVPDSVESLKSANIFANSAKVEKPFVPQILPALSSFPWRLPPSPLQGGKWHPCKLGDS